MITASCESRARISARTSRPLRSGKAKSSKTRSNGRSASLASPSSPVSAESTVKPSNSSKVSSDSRIAASSSIMSTEPALVTARGWRLKTAASDIDGLPDQGKFKMKGGALARQAVHPYLPCVFLDNSVRHRQSQAGAARLAFARCVLGCKKWIVDTVDVLRRNAGSGVADTYIHTCTVRSGDA